MTIIAPARFHAEGRLVGCYVYLLLCGDDKTIHIKIGMSQRPVERARELRNTSPLPIDLMATVDLPSRDMALRLEQDLHQALDEFRSNGEWFTFSPEDKRRFNDITRTVLEKYSSPSRKLKWSKMNLKEIAERALERQRLAQKKWRRGSLAYRDALLAGLTS